MLAIVALLLSPLTVLGRALDPGFTIDYFRPKNVEQIVVFACWKESGELLTRVSRDHVVYTVVVIIPLFSACRQLRLLPAHRQREHQDFLQRHTRRFEDGDDSQS